MTGHSKVALSVAIPTYRREAVLIQTVGLLLPLLGDGDELLVLDQTPAHEPATEAALAGWHAEGRIRWLRLPEPSIPKAMNRGLIEARNPHVVFFDDDIRPESDLLVTYRRAFSESPDVLIAGRVIQPWEERLVFTPDSEALFAGRRRREVREFIGCNFGVPRGTALALGGFDENFVRVAYRFEAEFAHRWRASGYRILFEPDATLHHLKAGDGGTRTYGEHLTTWRPDHAVGGYYFAFVTGQWREALARPWRAVATRHHLRRPWWILPTLWAELRGLVWALSLLWRGPQYAQPSALEATR